MGTTSLTLCFFILTIITNTWARTFLEVPEASASLQIAGYPERRYWKKNESIGPKINNDSDEEYYGQIVKRYLESETNEISRNERKIRSANDDKSIRPFSARRLEKMLEKAILKIITGDLSTADMLLLKSLNYSLDEVLAIRERELGKKIGKLDLPEIKTATEMTMSFDAEAADRKVSEESSTEPFQGNKLETKDDEVDNNTPIEKSSAEKKKKKSDAAKPVQDFDYEAYNRQAVYDYENSANNMSQPSELDPASSIVDRNNSFVENRETVETDDDFRTNFDRAMEPHVVFKIRYDDSEFDSHSDERLRQLSRERGGIFAQKRPHYDFMIPRKSQNRNVESVLSRSEILGVNGTPGNPKNNTFQESTVDLRYSIPIVYKLGNFVDSTEKAEKKIEDDERRIDDSRSTIEAGNDSSQSADSGLEIIKISSTTRESGNINDDLVVADSSVKNEFNNDLGKPKYAGLEWVEDDVYRVIADAVDSLDYEADANNLENETIGDSEENDTRTIDSDSKIGDDSNDTANYQNENPDDVVQTISTNSSTRNQANLSAYQQLALAHRRDQGQKAIEDIKLKVLAMTGRFNLSSSSNQVQRERLAMYSPICQMPRNTDSEAWSDAFSMNMHFQLNLTSSDHVVAAKLRIYKLSQDNVTLSNNAAAEEVDEEEKKIRISVYFYTKSLKKHRSKKRLMDSVVTALTTEGSHLALDVRQAIRFWRQNLRNSHGNSNNHGLVVQVEDQDGRPLIPSQYIEQDSCHGTERVEDDKAYQRVPAIFIQACSRYVRVVNGETVTYVNCSKSSRNERP